MHDGRRKASHPKARRSAGISSCALHTVRWDLARRRTRGISDTGDCVGRLKTGFEACGLCALCVYEEAWLIECSRVGECAGSNWQVLRSGFCILSIELAAPDNRIIIRVDGNSAGIIAPGSWV